MITKKIIAIVMASMVSATVWADDNDKLNMDSSPISFCKVPSATVIMMMRDLTKPIIRTMWLTLALP